MITRQQSHQAYAAAMRTMAGTRQVVMLYDAVLRNLQLAAQAMKERRIEDRYHRLTQASKIVIGLQNCLDFEKGGDMARILYNFYLSLDLRIFGLHRTASVVECEQILNEVRQMRDAWEAVDRESAGTSENSASVAESSPSEKAPPESVAFSA